VCRYVPGNGARGDGCGNTSPEYVEILEFDTGNEESSEETTGCKASVYAEFDDCPTTGNLVEILRFTHFVDFYSFDQIEENRREKVHITEITVVVALDMVTKDTKNFKDER
jgi:hypothetical protein